MTLAGILAAGAMYGAVTADNHEDRVRRFIVAGGSVAAVGVGYWLTVSEWDAGGLDLDPR